jgi:hypothetical protein
MALSSQMHLFLGVAFALSLAVSARAEDTPPAAGKLAQCPAILPFPDGIAVIKGVRVYTAANGESAFEPLTFTGEGKAYFKPGEIFTHNDLGASQKVQFISGPANVVLKPHTAPPEYFLTLQGSSVIVLPSGQEYAVNPGTLVFFDDSTSKTGHGGRTGPCGYVALNFWPAPPAPKP